MFDAAAGAAAVVAVAADALNAVVEVYASESNALRLSLDIDGKSFENSADGRLAAETGRGAPPRDAFVTVAGWRVVASAVVLTLPTASISSTCFAVSAMARIEVFVSSL